MRQWEFETFFFLKSGQRSLVKVSWALGVAVFKLNRDFSVDYYYRFPLHHNSEKDMERILLMSVYRESQTVFICLRKHFLRQERLHGKIKQVCAINRNKQTETRREIYWMQCDQSLNLQKMFVPWFVLLIVGYREFPSTKRVPFSLSLLFHRNWFCYMVSSNLFENSCKAMRNICKTALNPVSPIMWQMVLLFTMLWIYSFTSLRISVTLVFPMDTKFFVAHCFPELLWLTIRFQMLHGKKLFPSVTWKHSPVSILVISSLVHQQIKMAVQSRDY